MSVREAGFPFAFGFTVFDGWYNQNPPPAIIPVPAAADTPVGGHAVLCIGYDNSKSLFKIRNSWGPNEGDQGTCFGCEAGGQVTLGVPGQEIVRRPFVPY